MWSRRRPSNSNDNRAVRNYVHDQWGQSHPDGVQTFAGVHRLLLKDNLFLNTGQGWQCSNTYDANVTGNVWAGDHIEVNWDGVVRQVKEAAGGYIVFDPPIRSVHPYAWDTVANWRKTDKFALDLRLADDSPGKGMGEGGRDVGSSIDIQAYMKGDFNGDGKRDLPPAPKALDHETHTFDE